MGGKHVQIGEKVRMKKDPYKNRIGIIVEIIPKVEKNPPLYRIKVENGNVTIFRRSDFERDTDDDVDNDETGQEMANFETAGKRRNQATTGDPLPSSFKSAPHTPKTIANSNRTDKFDVLIKVFSPFSANHSNQKAILNERWKQTDQKGNENFTNGFESLIRNSEIGNSSSSQIVPNEKETFLNFTPNEKQINERKRKRDSDTEEVAKEEIALKRACRNDVSREISPQVSWTQFFPLKNVWIGLRESSEDLAVVLGQWANSLQLSASTDLDIDGFLQLQSFYSFSAFENFLSLLSETSDTFPDVNDSASIKDIYPETLTISSIFSSDLLFYDLLNVLDTLFQDQSIFNKQDEVNSPSFRIQPFRLTQNVFPEEIILNFKRFVFAEKSSLDSTIPDIFVLLRPIDAEKIVGGIVRRFDGELKISYFCAVRKLEEKEDTVVIEADDSRQESLQFVNLVLRTKRGGETFEDWELKEVTAEPTTDEEVVNLFKQTFSQIENYKLVKGISEVASPRRGGETEAQLPVFVLEWEDTRVTDLPTAPVSLPPPLFDSQIEIAQKLFEKVQNVIKSRSLSKFSGLDFRIFVPRYNSIRQQTVDRLGRFNDLVYGMSEADIANKVLLYPLQSKHLSNARDYQKQINDPASSKTLFLLIVDECHFAPTEGAIPMLHDKDLMRRENVVVLLVSATPYNVLSTQSRVTKDNVIDWMRVLQNADAKDTYIGFEYYARSMCFFVNHPNLVIEFNSSTFPVDLPPEKEYASYNAFTDTLNEKIADSMKSITKPPVIKFQWSPMKQRMLLTVSATRILKIHHSPLLSSLGWGSAVEWSPEIGTKGLQANDPLTIDNDFPVSQQLIRLDKSFKAYKEAIQHQFKYLSRTNDDGPISENSQKKKRSEKNRLSNQVQLFDLQMILKTDEYISVTRNRRTCLPPAEARNGFLIVLDYILSTCFYSLSLNCVSGKVSRKELSIFLDRLFKSCSYSDGKELFNLTAEMNFYLGLIVNEALSEMQRNSVTDDDKIDAIRYVLEEKLKAKGKASQTSDTESWFTETDRIIQMLMEKGSPIILLRCYDNDENRSLQKILRNCLMVCELKNKSGRSPAFSIIGDISRTRLLEVIEPEFRSREINHETFGSCRLDDIPKLRAKMLQSATGGGPTTKSTTISDDLKYEDIKGIPCLLILCEKGRMGDTFPQSLAVLDLRLRTCRAGSGFIQEMGRMCRYPATEKRFKYNKASTLPLDFTVSSGYFVFAGEKKSCVGLARSQVQFDKILGILKTSEDEIELAALKYSLPYALIEKDYADDIEKAIDRRENLVFQKKADSYERERENHRILSFVVCRNGLDDYLTKSSKRIGDDYKLANTKKHYDISNTLPGTKFENRLLLQAECQIGKTGAFLGMLYLLNHHLSVVPTLPAVSFKDNETKRGYLWYYPYWERMCKQDRIPYNFPQQGKYHSKILALRASLLNESYRNPEPEQFPSFVDKYQDLLRRKEWVVPFANTESRFQKAFDTILKNMEISDMEITEILQKLLNWDGRMVNSQEEIERFANQISDSGEIPSVRLMDFWDGAEDATLVQYDEEATFPIDQEKYNEDSMPIEVLLDDNFFSAQTYLSRIDSRHQKSTSGTIVLWKDGSYGDVKLWSPSSLASDLDGLLRKIDEVRNIEKGRQKINNLIFTPSYYGRSSLYEKYLFRQDCFKISQGNGLQSLQLVLWEDYVQILVVRQCQFEEYIKYFGGEFLIIEMPDNWVPQEPGEFPVVEMEEIGGDGRTRADIGGIGMVRRFIQHCAKYLFNADFIWILDDNIKDCYQLEIDPNDQDISQSLKYKKTSFATIMIHLENTMRNVEAAPNFLTSNEFTKAPRGLLRKPGSAPIVDRNQGIGDLGDFTGQSSAYGILGIGRVLNMQQPIKVPIKVTHSIYSFYLLNNQQCYEHKLYYPSRPVWEDIEMIHAMEQKGLICCKFQKFVHYKPPHGLKKQRPTPWYEAYRDWFSLCKLVKMGGNGANRLISQIYSEIEEFANSLPKASSSSSPDTYVVFVHGDNILPDVPVESVLQFVFNECGEIRSSRTEINRVLLIILPSKEFSFTDISSPFRYINSYNKVFSFSVTHQEIVDNKYRVIQLYSEK